MAVKSKSAGGSGKSFFKQTSALAGLAALAAIMPGAALAQDPAEEEEEDAIVVTGTRIQSEFTSTSPLQVITTENSQLAGVSDAGDMIQSSSIAAGSPQIDATISSAFVTDGGPGAQTISLRGLGANRTLVLLNGRRAGPAGTRGAVSAFDLNVLPIGIVDRVEILKDGASSIYGSDAIAGVVNIITDRNLEGGEVSLNLSVPQEIGGEEGGLDLTWGRSFDRGHINASLSYYHQNETLAGDRDYTNCGTSNTYDITSGARNDIIDLRTGQPACRGNVATGLVWLYDYGYFYGEGTLENGFGANFIQYDPTGQLGSIYPLTNIPGPLNPLQVGVPANWFQVNINEPGVADPAIGLVNTNSPFEQNSSIVPEVERTTAYVEGSYDIGANIEAYGELLLNRRETRTNGFRQVWTYLYSEDLGDPFSAGWTGVTVLSPTPTTDHADASQRVDYARIVAGMRGEFAGWLGPMNWDIYYQGSRSDAEYTNDRILADAVYSADGRSDFGTSGLFNANSIPRPFASCVGYNTPISNRPCVDVNWMSGNLMNGGGFTPAEEAFLYDVETGTTEYTQSYIEATISGDIFTLPAGNVGAAFGIVHREDELIDTPGEITLAGNAWGSSASGITVGEDTTQEFFAEVAIPIIRDAPFAESLELTLSGRYTDVDSSGEATTYKAGVAWQVTPEWLLRASHGTSFRAPALFELYLNGETSFPSQRAVDPCINTALNLGLGNITQTIFDNCASEGIPNNYTGAGASATAYRSGGAGLLEPETSEATVFGIVWTPRFADLQIAVDYFEIEVQDEVATLGAGQIVYGCYNSVNFPTDPLCTLFNRVGGGGSTQYLIENVFNSFLNINSQVNRGIDLTARYGHEFSFGDFSVQGQFTYQLEDQVSLFSGTTVDTNGSSGDPEFVGNIDFLLEQNDWTYFWRTQLIGETDDSDFNPNTNGTTTNYDIVGDFTVYHSASVRREFDNWAITLGVANILDQEPPTVTTIGAAGQTTLGPSILASQYDYVGRRAFLRFSAGF